MKCLWSMLLALAMVSPAYGQRCTGPDCQLQNWGMQQQQMGRQRQRQSRQQKQQPMPPMTSFDQPPQPPESAGVFCEPKPSVCIVYIHNGVIGPRNNAAKGSGTLISKGEDWGVVLSAAHLLWDTPSPVFECVWGQDVYSGKLCFNGMTACGKSSDVIFITLDRKPVEPVMTIAADYPQPGVSLTYAGWGRRENRYREESGTLRGYDPNPDDPGGYAAMLTMTGWPRSGDSGGPIMNAAGELVGVVSRTNAAKQMLMGTCNAQIWTCSEAPGYEFPWNKDLEAVGDRRKPQPVLPLPTGTTEVDNSGLDTLRAKVTTLQETVEQLQVKVDKASEAIAGSTSPEEVVAKLKGEIDEAKSLAVASHDEMAANKLAAMTAAAHANDAKKQAERVATDLEASLPSQVKALALTFVPQRAELSWGILSTIFGTQLALVFLAVIILSVIDHRRAKKNKRTIAKVLTDATPWEWDDHLGEFRQKRVEAHVAPGHGLKEELQDIVAGAKAAAKEAKDAAEQLADKIKGTEP